MTQAAPPTTTESRRHDAGWGRFAYVTLALVTVALIWTLALTTIVVNNTDKNTAQAINLATTAGQEHQRTLDEVFKQLDQTRQGTESELAKNRKLITDTTTSLTSVTNTNSSQWQEIAKSANQNVADASNQSLALVQSTLQHVEAQEAALQQALVNREAAAAARADALATTLRADLESARQRADAAAAAAAAAEQRAAAAVSSAEAAARAALQTTVDSLVARLARVEALLAELINHLPHPPGVDTALVAVGRSIAAVQEDLADVSAQIQGGKSTAADVSRITTRLHAVAATLSDAERALDQVRGRG